MPHPGAGASFELADAASVLQQIAPKLNDIGVDNSQDELVAIPFSPGVTVPLKQKYYGAVEKTYNLAGYWDSAIHTQLAAIQGAQGKAFRYGPLGNTVGQPKFEGTVNVGRINGPQQSSDGLILFTIALSVASEDFGAY